MSRSNYDLASILSGTQLPALPQSAVRLLELSQDPDNGPPEFAVPIESDPGLTGQVLRFVNSSYFGFAQEVTSIRLAITLVGVRTIKNFALWSAVFSLIPNPRCGPFDLKTLWQDSLRRAIFSREMAILLGVQDSDEIFTAALLQDMAVPLLAKELPDEYVELLQAREGGKVRLSQLEQERFGWTHGDAAAHIASSWSLPESFTRLLKGHAGKIDDIEDPSRFAIGISSLLPTAADSTWPDRDCMIGCFERRTQRDVPELRTMLESVDTEYAEFAPILKLGDATAPLVKLWDEVAEVASV